MTSDRSYIPVIILGAARSGTNVLRDTLTSVPSLKTWDCDEINAVWRHRNRSFATDELPPSLARPDVIRYIRGWFSRLASQTGARYVVEKTCANTVRVPFVDAVFPDAKYIHVVRDGRDVVASAIDRWTASFDFAYSMRKIRYTPATDVIPLVAEQVTKRFAKLLTSNSRLSSWGPKFAGMEAYREQGLAQVCAAQWRASVDLTDAAFAKIDPRRVFNLKYEDFVRDPGTHMASILAFLGSSGAVDTEKLIRITPASIGGWRTKLMAADAESIEPIVRASLERHGYAL